VSLVPVRHERRAIRSSNRNWTTRTISSRGALRGCTPPAREAWRRSGERHPLGRTQRACHGCASLSQCHFLIPRIKPGLLISLPQELVVIDKNSRICSLPPRKTAKTAGPRWPAAPDPGLNFPYSYLSNSGTYQKGRGPIAGEIPPGTERKILFDILASRA
jgi:hypothetical protein